MSWARVQNTSGTSGATTATTSTAATWGGATAAGNLLFATLVTDSDPGTINPASGYVQIGSTTGSGPYTAVFYAANASSQSGSKSFGHNSSRANVLLLAEYSGSNSIASPVDASDLLKTGSGTSLSTNTIATTGTNDLLIFVPSQENQVGTGGGTFSAPTNSFSILVQAQRGNSTLTVASSVAIADRLNVAANSYSAGCTSNLNAGWKGLIIAFSDTALSTGFPPLTPQHDQRYYAQPDHFQEWSAYAAQHALPQTYLPPPPLVNPAPSQRQDPLPDFWAQWQAYAPHPALPRTFLPDPPLINPARDTRQDPLPDYFQEWCAYLQSPYAAWYVPEPPPTAQPSQRWDPLPDWWSQFQAYAAHAALPATLLPGPPLINPPHSQRWDLGPAWDLSWWGTDPLRDYPFEWWGLYRKRWPVPVEHVPDSPQGRGQAAYDQRYYAQPDFFQEWCCYQATPVAAWFVPPEPRHPQPSQRQDTPPDLYDYWAQDYRWPLPVGFVGDSPLPRQSPQPVWPEEGWLFSAYLAYARPSWAPTYVPETPPPRPPAQLQPLPEEWSWQVLTAYHHFAQFLPPEPLPPPPPHSPYFGSWQPAADELDWCGWQPHRRPWPSEAPFLEEPPPRQPSQQLYFEPPTWDEVWWRVTHRLPIPTTVFVTQEGLSGVFVSVASGPQGNYRVANDIAGYNVYVGLGGLPDLTAPPAAFGHTLPLSVPVTPPVSGDLVIYVLVRAQDHYGLESQNQFYQTVTIDPSGNQILPPVGPPVGLELLQQKNFMVMVLSSYPGAASDPYPATHWRLWVSLGGPPNPSTDPFTLDTPVYGKALRQALGPFGPGPVWVAVALFRQADAFVSAAVSGSVTLGGLPPEVEAVPGGDQQEP